MWSVSQVGSGAPFSVAGVTHEFCMADTSNSYVLYKIQPDMLITGNRSKETNPACLNSVYAWVAFLLRLPVVGSCCGRAGAVDAGNPSTSSDGVRLVREAVSGVLTTDGPAGQGVLRLLQAAHHEFSWALSALQAISAPVRPLASALSWVLFLKSILFSELGQVEEVATPAAS